jgi:hypothetical protein
VSALGIDGGTTKWKSASPDTLDEPSDTAGPCSLQPQTHPGPIQRASLPRILWASDSVSPLVIRVPSQATGTVRVSRSHVEPILAAAGVGRQGLDAPYGRSLPMIQ